MGVQHDVPRVCVGSRVIVRFDDDGETLELTIRGREVDLEAGVISAASPLGRSIIGAAAGDQITYVVKGALQTVVVLGVLEPGS